jgi:general stress protein 26
MSDAENISKVTGIINGWHIGMFTTTNEEGALVGRPLAVQDVKDDGDMWFFTSANTSQVAHIKANPAVNVSFGQRTEWVSVAGRAEVVTDRPQWVKSKVTHSRMSVGESGTV